ncbi:OmpW/AlkL family protein [Halomonas urumqiensis]|uniref:OmpW family protein n=1 Tax=Halomonas urumqiensis TaxID=1684789 RepID=A0A2N7UKV2_9GAMM|nr:OmpW family outer membrane protein [Halomonas urumqiensis]PMR81052.1 hypothetical protein C1H70_06565 [Halomonas urumqiensis]PTB01091.1 hypothetical protein C6V82_16820 [Halomonas urumqiensis]GHE22816.1 outer membrane protein OmpW [Halomonas urumqiensis]
MSKSTIICSAVISASLLLTSQAALAFGAGDIFVRGGIAKTDTKDQNGTLDVAGDLNVYNARGLYYGVGYLFTDKIGMELSGQEPVDHILVTGNVGNIGTVDRTPVNLMANYYPLGGMASRVQPYVGVGINYTHFSGEELEGLDVDNTYGVVGQAGVDLAITDNLMLNGFANYADVKADVSLGAAELGEADIRPLTVGGGITYRF